MIIQLKKNLKKHIGLNKGNKMNNFTEWIQYFLNETENNLSSDKQISIIKTTLNLLSENKPENE